MAPGFEPKTPVQLDTPKDVPLTMNDVAQCDGERNNCMYIAIKGTVFDVTKNTKAYGIGTGYHALVGKDASRPLGKSSLNPEDTDPKVSWDYSSLDEKQLKTLNDWYTFFEKRYNIVGKLSDLPKN
jgi:predicted heme/steroid binding protein